MVNEILTHRREGGDLGVVSGGPRFRGDDSRAGHPIGAPATDPPRPLPRRMQRHPVPGDVLAPGDPDPVVAVYVVVDAVERRVGRPPYKPPPYNPPRSRITSLDAGRQRARIHARSGRLKAMQPAVGQRGRRQRWTKMALPAPGATGFVLWLVMTQMS